MILFHTSFSNQGLCIQWSSVIYIFFFSADDLLMLLTVASDSTVLPTTYGELRPPLGKHRLKVRSKHLSIYGRYYSF